MASAEDTSVAKDTLADPRWFPLRFDAQTDSYHFALIPAEVRREIAFLQDFKPAPAQMRALPRSAIGEIPGGDAPLHLILHSGLGGSTLVARVLAEPGVATPLLEPPILTDLVNYGLKKSSGELNRLVTQTVRLLARPLAPGEAVLCKLSGVGNGLARMMAAVHADSQLLCLENPLDQLLASFASRGIGGRVAARHLAIGLRNSRMFAFEMSDAQFVEHTDLQLAALAWLSIQKLMLAAAELFGPTRVASITSAQLMRDTVPALSAIAAHFRLRPEVDAWVAGDTLGRHAKSGEPFDPERRTQRLAEALRVHSAEIDPLVSWAKKIAEAAGIPWEVPYRLACPA